MSAREQTLAYLAGHNVMTLATEGTEGRWAAAVFYVNVGWTLYFLSSPKSRHSRNIAVRPGIAAAIQEDYSDWTEIKGVQMEGAAHRIEGAERAMAIECYERKFPIVRAESNPEAADPQASKPSKQAPDANAQIREAMSKITWFRFAPRRLYFIDNSLGLGHREEIIL